MSFKDEHGKLRSMNYNDLFSMGPMEIGNYFSPFWRPLFLAFLHHHDGLMDPHKEQALISFDSFQRGHVEKNRLGSFPFTFVYPPLASDSKTVFKTKRGKKRFFRMIHPIIISAHKFMKLKHPSYEVANSLAHDVAISQRTKSPKYSPLPAPESLKISEAPKFLQDTPGYRIAPNVHIPGVMDMELQEDEFIDVERILEPERYEMDDKGVRKLIPAKKAIVKELVPAYKPDQDFSDSEIDGVSEDEAVEDEPYSLTYATLLSILKGEVEKPSEGLPPGIMKEIPEWIKILEDVEKSKTTHGREELMWTVYPKMTQEGCFIEDKKLVIKKVTTATQMTKLVSLVLGEDKKLDTGFCDFLSKHTKIDPAEAAAVFITKPVAEEYKRVKMYLGDVYLLIKSALRDRLKSKVSSSSKVNDGSKTPAQALFDKKKYDMSNIIEFNETMRCEKKDPTAVGQLLSGFQIRKIMIEDWSFEVEDFGFTKEGIIHLLEKNGGDTSSKRDLIYYGIIQQLIEIGVLTGVKKGQVTYKLSDNTIASKFESLTDSLFNNIKMLTCTVLVVILFSYCQGINDRSLSWYESFSNVYGKFINEGRLVSICKAAHSCGTIGQIMDCLTIGDLKTLNNVFVYRLTRLSTPSLIKSALQLVPKWLILEEFSPEGLFQYRRFDEAGLPAHIALGPLSAYCKGKVNPLMVRNIPNDLLLSELAPIDEGPYHVDTIKKAKIILDIYKCKYGNWYQGNKAAEHVHMADARFKGLVQKVYDIIGDSAEVTSLNKEDLAKKAEFVKMNETAIVASILQGWV